MAVGTSQLEEGRDLHERPRHMTQQALLSASTSKQPLDKREVDLLTFTALQQGTVAALAAGAVSAALVFGASAWSPRIRAALNVSSKTGLIITPMFGMFYLRSHKFLGQAGKDPTAALSTAAVQQKVTQGLSLWHRAANAIFEHPCKTIVGIALPVYSAIFYKESSSPATARMLLSQRLIHTRVYGQAVVIATTIAVMSVGESMKDAGFYVIDEDGLLSRSNYIRKSSSARWCAIHVLMYSPSRGMTCFAPSCFT
ncbi:MAG: hypothetical protein SGPRY_001561 [Prymnesium sp.]